ncbi:MAG TPA: alpha-amylase family glycosyl hydrolase, partial [Chitinophagaceae bacterium]|nr:alpha-amylase family glycosyl hydrolase [Chitinophagaceae bacterium]
MALHFPIVSWAIGASIYEVNIRQYTTEGTIKSFQNNLLRLKEMGITILWFMPLTPISKEKRQGSLGSYYACSAYTKVNDEFGTAEDFKELVNQAHALGLKVIIDWVANHTGFNHEWAITNSDWFIKDEHGNFTEKNGWIDVIDLDYTNINMRSAMINAMQYWINEFDIDGFRCDMAHLVPLSFWYEARKHCDVIKELFWLAECDEDEYLNVFDANYAWQLMHISENYCKQKSTLNQIKDLLSTYNGLPTNTYKLLFTSNHDENSWNGTEYEKYGDAAKAFAVLSCTFKGISLLYSGQENPNLKRLAFFEKDTIQWNKTFLLEQFYTKLLNLRKNKAISQGQTNFISISN